MTHTPDVQGKDKELPYLSTLGAWALAFGCSVGWGAFIMPGTTFLPVAGPVGAALGLGLGALIMFVVAANYHYLMNRFPDGSGGVYTYTKRCFGYDHGFVSAWFLVLTYIAVLWANATALPLIARTLLGSTFQFGFHYEIAGFHVWMGEILLCIASLVIGAVLCLRRRAAEWTQIVMAVVLFGGIVVIFAVAAAKSGVTPAYAPAFSVKNGAFGGTFTIFALAPWAYVGFESISHSTSEAKYPLKRSFPIMAVALVTGGIAYALLALLAVTALPEGCASWTDYVAKLGDYSGVAGHPTFFAADKAMGSFGARFLGVAALCGIFTGIIGNYVALSRLIRCMARDAMLPGRLGELDNNEAPRNAILGILAVSVILPFFGRTAISWIVDVTTIGATIAYTFAAAAVWKTARTEKDVKHVVLGVVGVIVSLLFALEFLIPNITSVKTLSTESYLILAAWSIVGFLYFRAILVRDKDRRYGRSIVAWVILLGLIIFTSSVWMSQTTQTAIERSIEPIQTYYSDALEKLGVDVVAGATKDSSVYLKETMDKINVTFTMAIVIQVVLIVGALLILFDVNYRMQKREREIEVEKLLAEESSCAKTSFLSNMSHEIRTPMNAIIGLDNIALRNQNLQPQTREQLEKIGASAKHLLGLINDILDMSRIESGRMVLKSEEFSFRELLEQINIMINGQCVDKGLHYECDVAGHVADYYVGDDMKLKQVCINILGNSVKFTNTPGDVTLTVEELSREGDEATLRFTMKDTGIGMDKEFIPKIFEAFSQEDATATNRYGGSGLGMAITKNFVEMMGGEIRVESEKGVGSTFYVTVTLKTSDRVAHLEHGLTLPDNLRACVVDDDEIAAEHAQITLKTLGVETDVFTDGASAVREIRAAFDRGAPYDLLVTDYKMAAMNGLELTRSVRAFDGNRTAVIMLTGYNWDIIEDEAKEDGVDGILAKPIFADNLLREIHTVLMRRSGQGPLTEEQLEEETEKILSGRRVLMAEDVEQNAEILLDLLELEGVEADHAANGEIAVQMFRDHPAGYYDAVLMDVRMPVMDGLTATGEIRALDRSDAKTVPIIAMTANVFDEDVQRSLNAGMNAHLSKPIEPEKLYDTMAALIAERDEAAPRES